MATIFRPMKAALYLLLSFAGGPMLAQSAAHSGNMTPGRCCISEIGPYLTGDLGLVRKRFKMYQELGVEMVRPSLAWRDMEKNPGEWSDPADLGYIEAAIDAGFQIKLNMGTTCAPPGWYLDAHPDARIVNENGSYSRNLISPWYAGLHQLLEEKTERLFQFLSKHPEVVEHLAFIDPDFGPASEPIYPAAWTMGGSAKGDTYWCYGENAQSDFRNKMKAKYSDIDKANAAWKTTFANWDDVRIPKPGAQPGPFWADMLTWYRDTKRDFILWQLHDYQRLMAKYLPKPIEMIIYVPGRDYTESDWDKAVATAVGTSPIKLMCDSRFLIQTAAKEHCWLQYTASNNEAEVKHLCDYMRDLGYAGIPMWGENAGMNPMGERPLDLANIVVENRLYGLDLLIRALSSRRTRLLLTRFFRN